MKTVERLPTEVYAALVHSLYQNYTSMFAGALAASSAIMLTAIRVGWWPLWACVALTLAIGVWRTADMYFYAREQPVTTLSRARHWEWRYEIGAVAYGLGLGLWCFVGIGLVDDPIVHLLCASVTVGYTAAGAGRNCGRPRIVLLQIAVACGPFAASLAYHGGTYYFGLAAFVILFFVGLRRIAANLHQTYFQALIASRQVSAIAKRFDTALNNMPHGLCMFDSEGRAVVANVRMEELLGVPAQRFSEGATLAELLEASAEADILPSDALEHVNEAFARQFATNARSVIEVEGRRTLALTFEPMENGGSVVLVEDVTERRNAEAKIRHMARYDAVTGLPNRTFFRDLIDSTLHNLGEGPWPGAAVLFIDLDQFKQVNDTLGHPVGDHLLCAVADRLRRMVRPSDIVARFGGDEFVVFQSPLRAPDDAAALAMEIVERICANYQVDGQTVSIGASVGIALAEGRDVNADTLLKYADMALYRAKSEGRGTWRFFKPEMAEAAKARRGLELDLREALANDAFELFYQPLINLRTQRITTCEALLRWQHPERGMVSPGIIIPVAEEMGLIIDLGKWILRKACIECAKWPGSVRVAVNLSPIQFRRRDVVADVRGALAISGLDPARLEVEITESALLQDTEQTRAALQELRSIGVRISLDDFGTGYSSLSYLHSFPLQKVKIDRSFLQGLSPGSRPMTLLHGVARLSVDLGMSVVVEGVETEEQLRFIMAESSVDEAQGFLFAPPLPQGQIRELLKASVPLLRRVA